jgi:hypothetical protein
MEPINNIDALKQRRADLHPVVQTALQGKRQRGRQAALKGKLAKFIEGDFVLVARENFIAGENFRWAGRTTQNCQSTQRLRLYSRRSPQRAD